LVQSQPVFEGFSSFKRQNTATAFLLQGIERVVWPGCWKTGSGGSERCKLPELICLTDSFQYPVPAKPLSAYEHYVACFRPDLARVRDPLWTLRTECLVSGASDACMRAVELSFARSLAATLSSCATVLPLFANSLSGQVSVACGLVC